MTVKRLLRHLWVLLVGGMDVGCSTAHSMYAVQMKTSDRGWASCAGMSDFILRC